MMNLNQLQPTGDVFISYSSKDKLVADDICGNLEAAGINCWISPRDIAPGEDWPTAIAKAISQNRIMVLVFSAHSNSSEDVGRELILAAKNKLVIIPFKIENVDPEPGKQYYLARTHWLEALNPPTREQLSALLDCVKGLIQPSEIPGEAEVQPTPSSLPGNRQHIKTLDTFSNNLPVQLTSFIGREKEIAEVKRLLNEKRLVTITGPGGIGKTRLSLQVAADLLASFPDGVWLFELAPLADPALVLQTVTTALGLREERDRLLLDILTDYLRAKDVLLVLDNCEHLVEAAAQLTTSLLRACPRLHIIASSREALGVPGEMPYRVPPLAIPDARQLPPVEALAKYEAVELFIERARTVMPAFGLTHHNAPAVVQICQRLDGIPLAIELAAARTNLLNVGQIAARLNNAFRLLTGSSHIALPRQQTLRATIDWSYSMLSEPERILLRRLSVFAGGWTLEAVEAVCASAQVGFTEILDLLTSLVNKSLVMAEREPDQEARYHLLETVRQYAREKTSESGEAKAIQAAHLDYFLRLAERAEPETQAAEQGAWFDRLELEHDNFRAALGRSLEGGESEAEAGLRISGSLWWFWYMRGFSNEGGKWLEKTLNASQASAGLVTRAKALVKLGWLKLFEGAHYVEEGLALGQTLGPAGRESVALALWATGVWAYYEADYARAISLEEQSLKLFRELENRWGICESLTWSGMALIDKGDHQQAAPLLEESLRLARKAGISNEIHFALWQLSDVALARGDFEQATTLLEESLALCKEIKNPQGIAWLLGALGRVALQKRDYKQAISYHKEVLAQYWERGDELRIAEGLEQLADASAVYKQPERAARLLGAVESLRESIGAARQPFERQWQENRLEAIHSQLDEAAFAALWAEGRAMTLEEAVVFALNDQDG
jgi:predicted ATPase